MWCRGPGKQPQGLKDITAVVGKFPEAKLWVFFRLTHLPGVHPKWRLDHWRGWSWAGVAAHPPAQPPLAAGRGFPKDAQRPAQWAAAFSGVLLHGRMNPFYFNAINERQRRGGDGAGGERVCSGAEGRVHTGIQMLGDKDCD